MAKGEKKISVILEMEKFNVLEVYAKQVGEKYPVANVVREAIDEYIQRRENPEIINDQILQGLKNHPEWFAPTMQEQIKREVQSQLRQLFGEK